MKFFKKNVTVQQADTNKSRRFTLGQYFAAVSALLLSITAVSFATSIFTTFSSNTVISAGEVNANFQNINDQITLLTAAVSNVQAAATLEATTKANSAQAAAAIDATTKANNAQLTAMNQAIGYGQTWQNVTVSRGVGTTFTNSTGRPIEVKVTSIFNTSSASTYAFYVNGNLIDYQAVGQAGAGAGSQVTVGAIVPAGSTYSASLMGGLSTWWELR